MANDKHVAMLRKGVDVWNKWRMQEQTAFQGLSGPAELRLARAGLVNWEDLAWADRGPLLDLSKADLLNADLTGADLSSVDLSAADLEFADLKFANLSRATLNGANLSGANLFEATLFGTKLREADLTSAGLMLTRMIAADLTGANLTNARLADTIFSASYLIEAKGLDRCVHSGPSSIDFRTLENSGPLPIAFLRGIGVPERLIVSSSSSSITDDVVQHYSCFISYSSKDQAFAERLYADLQNNGVRCWFAPHDMPIGAKIIDAIDEAIRLRDKVLLILSEGAIASGWVEGEVTRALDEERTRKQIVLFPVRLDDAVMQTSEGWARLLRGQRNIGDFTRWKDHDSYQTSFERLMRDLRVKQDSSHAAETR
jgi:hypothetical protein